MAGWAPPAICIVIGLAVAVAPQPALAELRALLVGVSDYDDASGIADLRGPANDVRLLAETFRARGAQDIAIVADGVDGGTVPTRAAILSALDDMRERTTTGDLVYIHMSGHGTRQKDMSGDETDGWDEVFLPADTAKAERGSGIIPNALTDEEIGSAVDAIRRTGADVWFVLDSCHAGSGLRAAEISVASRFVDPSVLGIDDAGGAPTDPMVPPAFATVNQTADGEEPAGGLLAFYSAQSSEVAREVDFGGDVENWYGLFTAKLAARLKTPAQMSYRQLFQAVLSDMATADIPASARLQTPLWEGTFIDAPVFGGEAIDGVRQYAIDFDEISAGTLHGLTTDTVVALYADAAASPDDAIGFAQVSEAETLRAFVNPVSADCQAIAGTPCPAAGQLPSAARFARIVAKPVDFTVRYSPVTDADTGEALPDTHPAAVQFAEAIARAGDAAVIDADAHAIIVSEEEDGLRFSRSTGPTGLVWRSTDGPLDAVLTRIETAEKLAAALQTIAETASPFDTGNPVELTVDVVPSEPSRLRPVRALADRDAIRRECMSIVRGGGFGAPVSLDETGFTVKQCDQLAVAAKGKFPGARDVNRVYIDARFCVHAAYARIEDFATSGQVGPPMVMCSDCPDGPSSGAERLYVVSSDVRANAEAFNLEGVVENCRGPTRSAGQSAAVDYLSDLARGGPTRGVMGGFGAAEVWVQSYHWQVLPRAEALQRASIAVSVD